jgi:uncharacterized protein YjbJ (UPF0337 family)
MQTHTTDPRPDQTGGTEDQSAIQEVAGQAQEKVQELAGQAQEAAQQAAGQAQSKVREQIDQRSSQVAEQIGTQASDLRSVSQALRQQGKEGPAQAADRLAGYAEKVGGYLNNKTADQLLHDAEDLGRRQPWTVAAAGVALGFAASRFLKASSAQRSSQRSAPAAPPAPPRPASPPGNGFGELHRSLSDAPANPAGGPLIGHTPAPGAAPPVL